MIDVTRGSPELTKMAQEHSAPWKRYDALYRKLNGAPATPGQKPAP